MLWYLAAAAIASLVTFIFCTLRTIHHDMRRIVGTLRMDNSDPDDGPYLFLEILPGGMEKIRASKSVLLKVDLTNISRK